MIRRAAHTSLAVECDGHALAVRIEQCLDDLPVGDRADATIVLRADGTGHRVTVEWPDGVVEDMGTARSDAQALRLVAWVVSRQARRSVQHLPVLHAAVLAGRSGAVVLCGGTQTGKSTLTVAGVARGLHYLSDDMAILDVDAVTVEPFARPIMLRAGGRRLLHQRAVLRESDLPPDSEEETFVAAGRVGRVATEPLPVVAVAVIGRGDDPALEPLSPAATLQALVSHCVTLESDGAARFAELARLAGSCPGWSVSVDPAFRVIDQVVALAGGVSASG
jgi:hypothetical protein